MFNEIGICVFMLMIDLFSSGTLHRNQMMMLTFDNCVLMILCILLKAFVRFVVKLVFPYGLSSSNFTFYNMSAACFCALGSFRRCVPMCRYIKQ